MLKGACKWQKKLDLQLRNLNVNAVITKWKIAIYLCCFVKRYGVLTRQIKNVSAERAFFEQLR